MAVADDGAGARREGEGKRLLGGKLRLTSPRAKTLRGELEVGGRNCTGRKRRRRTRSERQGEEVAGKGNLGASGRRSRRARRGTDTKGEEGETAPRPLSLPFCVSKFGWRHAIICGERRVGWARREGGTERVAEPTGGGGGRPRSLGGASRPAESGAAVK